MNKTKSSFYKEVRMKDELVKLVKENQELLNALNKLWSVRGTPWTLEQTQQQERIYAEVEIVLKKYT